MTLETSSLRRATTAFSALALLLWLGFDRPESPIFLRQPLSFWLRQVRLEAPSRHAQCLEALVALQPYTDPALRRALTASPSPLNVLHARAHRFAPSFFSRPRDLESSRGLAVETAQRMNDRGQHLLPDLAVAFRVTSRAEIRESIIQILRASGKDGMAALSALALAPDFPGSEAAIRALVAFHVSTPDVENRLALLAAIATTRLSSTNVHIVLAASDALIHTGDQGQAGIPGVLSNLSHVNPAVRATSANTLARVGRDDPRCIEALLTRLEDSHPEVRAAAASGLGHLGSKAAAAVPKLEQTLFDESLPVTLAALQSLGRIGPKADHAVARIAEFLGNDSHSPVLKAAAASAMARIGQRPEIAVPGLIRAIQDPDTYVRCQAAKALSAFGAHAAPSVTALSEALFDPSEAVRMDAAAALASIGPAAQSAIPSLIAARNNNPSVMNPPVVAALARIQP